jgi:hypothetical protein
MVPDLRHTFITGTRRAGGPTTVTMSATGHAIRGMNERYDTVEDREKGEAIRKLVDYRQSVAKVLPEKIKYVISSYKSGGSAQGWESDPIISFLTFALKSFRSGVF